MKPIFLGLLAFSLPVGALIAQPGLEKRLSENIKPAPERFGVVTDVDQKLAIRKVAYILSQHVTFRTDGTAATFYDAPTGRHYVEWKDLHIKMIVATKLTRDDQKNGVTKRVQAMLTYQSCRILNPKTNVWTAWGLKSHPLFPPVINVAWINGHATPDGGMHLKRFKPGPLTTQDIATLGKDLTAADPDNAITPGIKPGVKAPTQGTFKPANDSGGLPPGMKRAE